MKKRSELLIYGYIKNINNNVIIGVMDIISEFYGSKYDDLFIAIFSGGCVIEFDVTKEIKSKVFESNMFNKDYGWQAMYCFGDENIYKIGTKLGDNFKYNINTHKNISLPDNIIQRSAGDVLYSNKHGLIVIGGAHDNIGGQFITYEYVYDSSVEILEDNASNWKTLSPLITPKAGLGCCLFNDDFIFECGGTNTTTRNNRKSYFDTCSLYNFNDNKWRSLTNMNNDRAECAAIYNYIKNTIIVGGGYPAIKSMEYYELNKDIWINMPNTIYDHSRKSCLFVQSNGVIIIGGQSFATENTFEMFDPRNNEWHKIDTLKNMINIDRQLGGLLFLGKV